MPNRLIKDSLCTSDKVNALSDFEFRVWVSLITYVDDYGRGDARPAIIKGRCFPLRNDATQEKISEALSALEKSGCIKTYDVDGGKYFCFPRWEMHQKIRNKKSKYPEPNDKCCRQLKSIADNCGQLQVNVPVIQSNPIQSESESEYNPNSGGGVVDAAECERLAKIRFRIADPTEAEIELISQRGYETALDGERVVRKLNADRLDLLEYAFSAAERAGKKRDTRFVEGILRNLYDRGIKTRDAAESYDAERVKP